MKEKNNYLLDFGYVDGKPYLICKTLEEDFMEVKEVVVDEDLLD